VHLPTGVELMAAACALAATVATIGMLAAGRRRAGAARQAHLLFLAGAALSTITVVVGLSGVVYYGGAHWEHHGTARADLATALAVGAAAASVLMCAGLLRLPWAAGSRAVAGRHLLDALVIGFALWFVGWVLVATPGSAVAGYFPRGCPPVLISAGASALAVGVAIVVVVRGAASRRRLLMLGTGVTAVAGAGAWLATGVCLGGPATALFAAAALPVALGMVWAAARGDDPAAVVDHDVIPRGTGVAFLPMVAMTFSAMYLVMAGGTITTMGIALASLEGFALVARQSVALADVRRYAGRLLEGESHFKELAHTDPLTGLANRRGLLRALYEEVEGGPPCVLLTLDLDGFKNVNDMRGHDVGDQVLIEVGQRLRMNLRPGDVAARLGGDEFAVLMWCRPSEAYRAAERLLGVLSKPYEKDHARVFLSVSIGLAGGDTAPDVPTLLSRSDLALRYAKQRGKNRVERYDASYDRLLRRRTTLEHELRGAVERDELHLAFQPVVVMPSVRPVGAEALLRWHHPELGSVRPDEFIPLAEESGMISALGEWVLHQACHQLSRWLSDGHDVWVSVNVSPRELHNPDYVEQVEKALRAHRVPPQRLVLEVTEQAVATDIDELIRRLRALRATGVRIALDDFGSGYSSLGQLRRLPIDILKIDHSLVAECPEVIARGESPGAPMVDVVVRLGHQLGLEVIAEGVTNQRELAAVVEAGCRFGQGQLFGWGVPAEHLEAMLEAATSPGARLPAAPASPAALQAVLPPPPPPPPLPPAALQAVVPASPPPAALPPGDQIPAGNVTPRPYVTGSAAPAPRAGDPPPVPAQASHDRSGPPPAAPSADSPARRAGAAAVHAAAGPASPTPDRGDVVARSSAGRGRAGDATSVSASQSPAGHAPPTPDGGDTVARSSAGRSRAGGPAPRSAGGDQDPAAVAGDEGQPKPADPGGDGRAVSSGRGGTSDAAGDDDEPTVPIVSGAAGRPADDPEQTVAIGRVAEPDTTVPLSRPPTVAITRPGGDDGRRRETPPLRM
jgi:diguanylate cyclase